MRSIPAYLCAIWTEFQSSLETLTRFVQLTKFQLCDGRIFVIHEFRGTFRGSPVVVSNCLFQFSKVLQGLAQVIPGVRIVWTQLNCPPEAFHCLCASPTFKQGQAQIVMGLGHF